MKIKIILLGVVMLFFLAGLITAELNYKDYTQKWNLCNALNYTQITCDVWWENISTEVLKNYSFNVADYYNKSEVDYFFSNFTNSSYFRNFTITINNTNYSREELLMFMRDSGIFTLVVNNPYNQSYYQQTYQQQTYQPANTSNSGYNSLFIVMFILIAVMIAMFSFIFIKMNNRKDRVSDYGGQRRVYPLPDNRYYGDDIPDEKIDEYIKKKEEIDNEKFQKDRENVRKKNG